MSQKKRKIENEDMYFEYPNDKEKLDELFKETPYEIDLTKDQQKEIDESPRNNLNCIISEIEEKLDIYLDYDVILEQFKEIILKNNLGMKNRCTECNVDMGLCNPRQLCGKTYCSNES